MIHDGIRFRRAPSLYYTSIFRTLKAPQSYERDQKALKRLRGDNEIL